MLSRTPITRESIDRLSPRQREVARRLALGQSNKLIASELGIAGQTVKNYVCQIFATLYIVRRGELVAARDLFMAEVGQ
jgi:DNA-binding NarL/FixJ family response regulator